MELVELDFLVSCHSTRTHRTIQLNLEPGGYRPRPRQLQSPSAMTLTERPSITSMNDDTIRLVVEAIIESTPSTSWYHDDPLNPGRGLLPLSLTCKRLREQCLPIIFREAYARRWGMHPRNTWKYIQILHLQNHTPKNGKPEMAIDLGTFERNIPSFPVLKRLVLKLSGPPPDTLLQAASVAPTLEDLAIQDAWLDGPRLSGFSHFTHLRRLTLSASWSQKFPAFSLDERLGNVRSCFQSLSLQLCELEVAGDFCGVCTLAEAPWPCLYSLTLTGHAPAWDPIDLSVAVARMPVLTTLHMDFSVYYESPWSHLPAFIYVPRIESDGPTLSQKPFRRALPHLTSLVLSNVAYPNDDILDQLPERLTSLRVKASKDPASGDTLYGSPSSGTIPMWHGYNPVSLSTAFHIVHQTAQLPALTELVLTLDCVPPPDLVYAISRACPRIAVLVLQDVMYGGHNSYGNQSSLDTMAEALISLRRLHTLHISVTDWQPTGHVMLAQSSNMQPFQHFVEKLAQATTNLKYVWLTCLDDFVWHIRVGRTPYWCKYEIRLDDQGQPCVSPR